MNMYHKSGFSNARNSAKWHHGCFLPDLSHFYYTCRFCWSLAYSSHPTQRSCWSGWVTY